MTARLPIRWRLTLWYAALFGGTLLLFGTGLYFGLRVRLHDTIDEQLTAQTSLVRGTIRIDGGGPTLAGDLIALDDELFVRLLDEDGTVVVDSGAAFEGPLLAPGPFAAARRGQTTIASLTMDDDPLRVMTTPVRRQGEIIGILQVGLPIEEIDEALSGVLTLLALAAPLLLALAVGGGYLLAGWALAPVATMTALASQVSGQALDARLNLDLPDDELGRLARTFDAMLARVEEAFERQRRFTGDAAHELRTPLSLMRGEVDLALARPRSADEYRQALEGLDEDLARMTGLVGALLTLARADAGKLAPDPRPLDLAETVELVIEQYAGAAADAGVTIVNEAIPSPLVADEDLLVQALVNLIDNALAHTPPGGEVRVGCRPDGDTVRLWVADTGSGIPPEHQDRVFDRFYRVDPGRGRERGGTGLGLAICREIVEAHGGTIAVASEPGRGTRLEVVLLASAAIPR